MLLALLAACHPHGGESNPPNDSDTAPELRDDDLGVTCPVSAVPLAAAPTPVASTPFLPTSNGWIAASYAIDARGVPVSFTDGSTGAVDQARAVVSFSDHLAARPTATTSSRDLLWDSYFGVRVNGVSTWLNTVPTLAVDYETGTGIIVSTAQVGDVTVTTYVFAPFAGGATRDLVMIATVFDSSDHAVTADLFSVANAHVGGEGHADGESVAADGDAIVERRGADLVVHTAIDHPVHFAAAPAGDGRNPWVRGTNAQDLGDELVSGDDVAVGFEWGIGGPLQPGDSFSRGFVLSLDDGTGDVPDRVRAWLDGRSAASLVNDERDAWTAWHALDTPPPGLSADEDAVFRQSLAVLRMAQVRVDGPGHGQILASLPPGVWNTAWPRDMAYATVALADGGHPDEARDAARFVIGASAGDYADRLGIDDYLVSACRYTGDGREESDGAGCPDGSDAGPNVELDDFGLFLWAYHRVATGDPELEAALPVVEAGVSDRLVQLVDPNRELLVPDSSIWERHWETCFPNGRKHFTFSSVWAVAGLRRASLAAGSEDPYGPVATALRGGLLRTSDDLGPVVMAGDCPFLASSPEEICDGCGPLDVSVVEAIDQGVLRPDSSLAIGTLLAMDGLRMDGSPGFLRNDDGAGTTNPYPWYDDQEWVYADLRLAVANAYVGRATGDAVLVANGDGLVDWITAQAVANHGLIPELLSDGRYTAEDDVDRVRPGVDLGAEYQGAVPMAGFGAGAYILALEAVHE